jgi:hypothetical protein
MRVRVALHGCGLAFLLIGFPTPASAHPLRDALIPNATIGFVNAKGQAVKDPTLSGALAPLAGAFGAQITNQIPAVSTSAGFTYEIDPELEVPRRTARTFGPIFTDRAVTLGRGKFDVNASYSYISFKNAYGKSLDHIRGAFETAKDENGNDTFFPRGFGLASDFATLDPRYSVDVKTHLWDFSFTYGVLRNLDFNIDLPLLYTEVDSSLELISPDARCVGEFSQCQQESDNNPFVPGASGSTVVLNTSTGDSALGLGDMSFRAKYKIPIPAPFSVAGFLGLQVPTGKKENLQGTGDWRLEPRVIVSGDLLDFMKLEGHLQGGVEFNINDVDSSQARYAAGITFQPFSIAAITVDFVGRSEFANLSPVSSEGRLPAVKDGVVQEPTVDENGNRLVDENGVPTGHGKPLFINFQRNDIFDLSIGGKFAIADNAIIFLNFSVPLNSDGIRPDFIPTGGVEVSF